MSRKRQNPTENAFSQKWQLLQDSISAAEVLVAEETTQSGDTAKSARLLAVRKNLVLAKNLIGEISAGLPTMQRLASLASFPEFNINPILELNLIGAVEYINPAALRLFPDLQEKGLEHPYLAGWPQTVERVYQEPAHYLDREVQVESRYYQQSIIFIQEHNSFRVYGYDITNRENAEQALQQSERRFRTLIDKAPVAIALSRESKFLYVNPAYLELHGIDSQAELLGRSIYERVAPESLDDSKVRAYRRAHSLPVESSYEYAALRKDGALVPVIAAVTGVTLADGPATVGFFQDIRQLKQMQQEREELLALVQMERDQMRSLLENMNDEVWFCDQDGKILLANRAAIQNIGYNSLNELLTTVSALAEDLDFYNSDGTPRTADEVALVRTLKEQAPVFGEDIVRNRRTGELKYREFNTAPIRSEAGQLLGAMAVVRDISQRVQAEHALQQSQTLLNAILNGTPDPVFLKDRDSRILMANPATLAAIGKPAEQVIGKNDAEFYDDPAVGRAIVEHDRLVMESGQTEVVEEQISTPGNERVFLSTKTPYRDAEGNVIGIIGVAHDITDRNKREAELYQLSRTLRAISNSNQALMHADSETQFLDQVCDIVVKDCGYKMVWIGFALQDEAKTVQPVASAGFEQGYLDTLNITWADTERGQGPTGTAIRSGKPSLCRDMRTNPNFKPWYAEAVKRGYASSLVLPLMSGGQAFGALTIYSEVLDPFTDDEIKLLSELSNDLAYGITSLRLRAANLMVEEALRESEEKYRRLIENVTDLVCEVDSQARFLFVNSQYEQVLGYTPGELIGKYTRDLIHPDDLRVSTPAFKQLVNGKSISHNEWRFKHKKGEWRWFDCMGQTYEKSPGDTRVVVISRDVTERKQMEEALRTSERRYRTLFEGMTEGFALHEIVCDENGEPCDYRFLELNPAFERLTGLRKEDVIGKLHNTILPDDDPNWVKIYGKVALTGQPAHFENYSPALKAHYEVFSYCPTPGQFAVLFMNITERKLAEEKLLFQATLLANISDIVYATDLELRITAWNQAAEKLYGWQEADVLGKPVVDVVQSTFDPGLRKKLTQELVEKGSVIAELEHHSRNGNTIIFEAQTLVLRDAAGRIFGYVSVNHDITERKLAEEKLRASEERYRRLFENIQETLVVQEIVFDEAGKPIDLRYVDVNPVAEQTLGKTRSELIGHTRAELGMPPDPAGVEIAVRVLSTGTQYYMVRHFPILKTWSESYTYSLGPGSVVTLALDITERKQAEEQLQEHARMLDLAHVLVRDMDGKIIFWNRGAEKLYGWSKDEALGKLTHHLFQTVFPHSQEEVGQDLLKYGVWEGELIHTKRDGSKLFVASHQVLHRDQDNRPVAIIEVNNDVTALKQAEEALQKAHDELEQRVQERTEQLQIINEELNAEIVERKEAEEIIHQNATRAENLAETSRRLAAAGLSQQRVCEIISRSMAELIGDTSIVRLLSEDGQELQLASIYHKDPALRERFSNFMQDLPIKVGEGISGKVITTGRSFFLPSTASHKLMRLIEPQELPGVEGLQIYSLMVVPLYQEEKIIGTIAVMGSPQRKPYTQEDLLFLEDLAGRASLSLTKARIYQELENALEREQQTRIQLIQSEKNSALARMVASVAHEINNPVQTIKNCMYLLANSIDQAPPTGEILNMATSEANRIGDLVSRLRDLYRPSKELSLKKVNILEVLANVSALLEPHLQHNKVKLDIETCTDRVYVTANADQIKQVFLNISLNAIDAMQPVGGRLTAKVSCPTALQTCISFSDTGKGISSEEMQHIFEPLYTTKDKGTGLGLAISHEIVKNHNGYITVESQPGQGATFSVWLPTIRTGENGSE